MFKQLYTSVGAAFQSVPFPFIHIHHPASPPIHRHYTAPHYFIADICHPLHPRLPAAFNISAATPDGPAALPLFALDIAELTSDTDISLSSTDAYFRHQYFSFSTLFISPMPPILSLFQSNSS